ncbi:MAG: hypothetical protein ACKVZJ_05655 [Phycisphaerales bacterium]
MIGTFEGTVVGVAPASIHGDVYYDLLLWPAGSPTPDDEAAIRAGAVHARVPSHLCKGVSPRAGQRLRLTMLLGQVSGVEVA